MWSAPDSLLISKCMASWNYSSFKSELLGDMSMSSVVCSHLLDIFTKNFIAEYNNDEF